MIENYAKSFGMNVFLNDPSKSELNKSDKQKYMRLDEGLKSLKYIPMCFY